MLPPFIIEQIKRREEQERVQPLQPQLELPVDVPRPHPVRPSEDRADRGVLILEL